MIDKLSVLLKNFIKTMFTGEKTEIASVEVVLSKPDDTFSPFEHTIGLCLVDMYENTDLRSNEPLVEYDPVRGTASVRKPPMRLSCSYLVTGWPGKSETYKSEEEKTQKEHQLLGMLIMLLASFPVIPAEFVKGSGLAFEDTPLPMISLQKEANKNISELWTSMRCNFKPSFTLTATICIPCYGKDEFHLFTKLGGTFESTGGSNDSKKLQAGGVVRCGNEPVPLAVVEIRELGLKTSTDTQGMYIFSGIPEGEYTFDISAPGYYPQVGKKVVISSLEKGDLTIYLARK